MNVCKETVKWFVEQNQDVCPCNAAPQTRCGCYPKWALTVSRSADGAVWRNVGCHVLKSSCLNHGNLQNLIMDGDAVPLPADFCEVVDSLETWGACHWTGWMTRALHLMHEHLKDDDNMHGGIAPNKMKLFHDCILLRAERETMFCFLLNSANFTRVLDSWNTHFWARCRETHSFHELATDSIHCVDEMLRSIRREQRAQTPSAPTNANMETLGRAAVVPESPISVSVSTHAGESTQE